MKWQEVIPVGISVTVIILIAVLQRHSKLVAGITATMPILIPLSFWIVYNANDGKQAAMEKYARGLLTGVIPTLAFVLVLWIGTHRGLKILPVLGLGYTAWAVILSLILFAQRLRGVR